MHRILVAGCEQEVSSFNPVRSSYDLFHVQRGEDVLTMAGRANTCIRGALEVFGQHGQVRVLPTFAAKATSAGPLEQASFERLAGEFLDALRPHAGQVDGVYFSLHGAMGCSDGQGGGELDPEGWLLEQARAILGEAVPIVISLDLHGIVTEKMLRHVNGLAAFFTYPHVDMVQTGQRAARLLLRILEQGARPVMARVTVPALVRGDELITETGCYGEQIRHCQALETNPDVLAAAFMIGNPFTDVPELCSQALVVTDGDEALAREHALKMAADFWDNRTRMQGRLVPLSEAVAQAKDIAGTVMFTDAADATSSGASGDSNAILAELVRQDYRGRTLLPLVDPPAAASAFQAGVGGRFRVALGGALDPRFTPLELDVEVTMLSRGRYRSEYNGMAQNAGRAAVLRSGPYTIVVTERTVPLLDRSLFLAHGQNPRDFDAVVVKSPHCRHEYYDAWVARNLNVDAPGSTSANLRSLGHRVCARPMFPLDDAVTFSPQVQVFQR